MLQRPLCDDISPLFKLRASLHWRKHFPDMFCNEKVCACVCGGGGGRKRQFRKPPIGVRVCVDRGGGGSAGGGW